MSTVPKWTVVHNAARDFYQLPLALEEQDCLHRFVTDWYTPLDRATWQLLRKLGLFSVALGLQGRFTEGLPSSHVTDSKLSFLMGLLKRKLSGLGYDDVTEGDRVGRKAAEVANSSGTSLLAASYCGNSAFRLADGSHRKALFQVHPHPRFLRSVYHEFMQKDEAYAGLVNEPEMSVPESVLDMWAQESSQADLVLCASRFTTRSLVESGIANDRVRLISYGVNTDVFKVGRPAGSDEIRFLYVGQKVARKSLAVLLDVWSEIRPRNAKLIVAGGHVRDSSIVDKYAGLYEEMPRMALSRLVELYGTSHVFILPSIAEGFGHVYLEALSCGTPIICTQNTGAADIIQDGESGWCLTAGDREELRARILWCIENPAGLLSMRSAARAVAEQHTWPTFRSELRAALGV